MTNSSTIKPTISFILLLLTIQSNHSLQPPIPSCGNIAYCQRYTPDPCNTCSCPDPINNPTLSGCTSAHCDSPLTFIPECTLCMDNYILNSNKNCIPISFNPIEIIDPIQISIPPQLPPSISISPLPINPCMCTDQYAPVCCNDRNTYSNKCMAQCNGLTECINGECNTNTPITIDPLPCKYLPACQDPCLPYYNFGLNPNIQCYGYPNAQCQSKTDCDGCYAIFVDEYGNEIDCIPPPTDIEPIISKVICNSNVNCDTWQGFGCRYDIKCRMNTNMNPNIICDKVCLSINGLCSVNNDCAFGYYCIEGFCTKYQEYGAPIIAIGRPYNLNKNLMDLKAELKTINCDEYKFYFNDIKFAYENINKNVSINDEIIMDWMNRILSEHASVATFAKFNLDLMSIAAPLWLLEIGNNASLDEIEHTKMSFDILNMYIKNGYNLNNNKCYLYDKFPIHNVSVDSDYNRISLDAANGGCLGETLSVSATYLNGYDNKNDVIKRYLYRIAMDEIRHASFSWVVVKWIIDKRGNEVDVADVKWWERRLLEMNKQINGNVEQYVYKYVMPAILKLLWKDNGDVIYIEDYKGLYGDINSLLMEHLNGIITNISSLERKK